MKAISEKVPIQETNDKTDFHTYFSEMCDVALLMVPDSRCVKTIWPDSSPKTYRKILTAANSGFWSEQLMKIF